MYVFTGDQKEHPLFVLLSKSDKKVNHFNFIKFVVVFFTIFDSNLMKNV